MSLGTLVVEAEKRGSSAVLVARGDDPVLTWPPGVGAEPTELMSVTKLVVAVALGAALPGVNPVAELGRPVSTWIEEWAGDERRAITLQHLLTHTSGLAAHAPRDVYDSGDLVALGVSSELETEPGRAFRYNNSAYNLVGEVVRRSAGRSLADLAAERLFDPLRFGPWLWRTDDAGGLFCMSDLQLCASDLLKIGQLLLAGGRCGEEQLVPRAWVEALPPAPGEGVGLGCFSQHAWVRFDYGERHLEAAREAGLQPAVLTLLGSLVGTALGATELLARLSEAIGVEEAARLLGSGAVPRGTPDIGPVIGFGHDGDLGQHLVVLPELNAVAVRQRTSGGYDDAEAAWSEFPGDVWAALRT